MINIRSAEEIELLRKSNDLVSRTLAEVAKILKPGITTEELDKRAEEFIFDNKAVPGFKGYNKYPKTLCTSINSQVVHGIPGNVVLKEGDIISVDCGVILNKYYGDSAYTFAIGEIEEPVKLLLRKTKESLFLGIQQAVEGKRVGDISYSIQTYCESFGYSVVREMVGHGLGTKLHEAPEVPNYGKRGSGPVLRKGMVICIEPMINMGTKRIFQEKDGWTIRTHDNKPSAHFELALAIDKEKADVLSTFSYIENVLGNREF
jgi:methionyl aminopeptidase